MRLFFWRRQRSDDFAEAIAPELRALPTPQPSDALKARILASRAAGVRTILPEVAQPRPRRALLTIAVAGFAAALLLIALPIGWRRENKPPSNAEGLEVASSGFFGRVAYAQTLRDRPELPAVRVGGTENLRPTTLGFARRLRDASGKVVSDLPILLTIRTTSVDGIPAYVVASLDSNANDPQPHVSVETTWVARADLRLLRRTVRVSPYSRYERINVQQRFAGDSITGHMWTDNPSIGAGRTFARALPRAYAPYLTPSFAPVFFMGVRFERGWRGSASVLGWAVRDDDVLVPIELRVDGSDVIETSAGRFDCWRLSLRASGRQLSYWVRKSDGLGVRVFDPNNPRTHGTREIVLVREGEE